MCYELNEDGAGRCEGKGKRQSCGNPFIRAACCKPILRIIDTYNSVRHFVSRQFPSSILGQKIAGVDTKGRGTKICLGSGRSSGRGSRCLLSLWLGSGDGSRGLSSLLLLLGRGLGGGGLSLVAI